MPLYDFIEHSSNYSGSLWFYSKDEVTSFNVNPNKAALFRSSFFWGEWGSVQFHFLPPPSYFKKKLFNININ